MDKSEASELNAAAFGLSPQINGDGWMKRLEFPKLANVPCDTCKHYKLCATKSMACRSFYQWMADGRKNSIKRTPSRSYFNLIYPQPDTMAAVCI